MPWPVFNHLVVVDAVAFSFLKGAIRNLEHADRAGGGPVPFQRVRRPAPAPVGPRHGITRAFRLSQRREKFRRDCCRGMLAEEGTVFSPRVSRAFIESPVQRKEDLAWLGIGMVSPVDAEPEDEQGRQNNDGPYGRRGFEHGLVDPAESAPAAAEETEERFESKVAAGAAAPTGGTNVGAGHGLL